MTILKIMSIFLLAGVTGCAASASNVPAADLDFIGKTKADVIRARGEPGRVTNYYLGGALLVYVSDRSEEHTSELQSLMRISYAVFCLTKKINKKYMTFT